MGWTTVNQSVPNTKEFLSKQFCYETPEGNYVKIVECKTKGTVAYLAIEHGNVNTEASVSGVVVLIKRSKGTFSYKIMQEDMHPYYYNCPKSILDRLSETDNHYAQSWRKGCRDNLAMKETCKNIETGDTLVFDQGFTFGKCGSDDTFRCSDPKRGFYYAVHLGIAVKLTTSNLTSREFLIRKAA